MKKKHAKAPIKRSESGAKRNNLAVNVEQKPVVDDPWLALLDHLNEHAVDTGIEDLSLNHDHYLYGVPKR